MTVIIRNSLRHVGLSTLRRRRLPSTNSPFVSCQSSKSFRYVAHEGNSWQLRLPKTGVGILVDPWLVGKLTFADQDWLFKGSKISEMPSLKQVELETDLLLITQGLDDHAHRPTLKQLSKTTPVVASPSAATVCRELGFQDVTECAPFPATPDYRHSHKSLKRVFPRNPVSLVYLWPTVPFKAPCRGSLHSLR